MPNLIIFQKFGHQKTPKETSFVFRHTDILRRIESGDTLE